jgi:hypothetical protein
MNMLEEVLEMNKFILFCINIFIFLSSIFSVSVLANTTQEHELSLVTEFQTISEQWPFCSNTGWERGGNPEIVIPEMRRFLSTEMLRLFVWIQCEEPRPPRPLSDDQNYYWDFRYGTAAMGGLHGVKVLNIYKLRTSSQINKVVIVEYEYGTLKQLWARYTLVKENGTWKIDDIALKGYKLDMGEEGEDQLLPASKSLKTELQAAYKRAEDKYNRDQAAKGVSVK